MLDSLTDRAGDAVSRTAGRAFFVSALLLERTLSHAHSAIHTSSFLGRMVGEANDDGPSQRAWWDTKKGSAVVVWAAGGDQNLSHALALALASVRSRTSGSSRAGQPPYTVIVLLPESSDGLATLVGAWAKRKAEAAAESDIVGKTAETKRTQSRAVRRRSPLRRVWDLLGLDSLVVRLRSSDGTYAERMVPGSEDDDFQVEADLNEEQRRNDYNGSDDPFALSETNRQPQGRRRSLSFGGWSAQDMVGYGRDMLKGLRIGQTEETGLGAVIPVTVDTSTHEGLLHAQSTIQAYCMSHDLLLRALILVPSVMAGSVNAQNSITVPSSTPPAPQLWQTGLASERLSSMAMQTHDRLSSDVGEQLSLLATLLPVLKSDGGRVIGLVPTAAQTPTKSTRASQATSALPFAVTRNAVIEMWSSVRGILEDEGVRTSVVHMTPTAKTTAMYAKSLRNPPRHTIVGGRRAKRSHGNALLDPLRHLVLRLLCAAYPMLYGTYTTTAFLSASKRQATSPAPRKLAAPVPSKLATPNAANASWQATSLADLRGESPFASPPPSPRSRRSIERESETASGCPALLLDAVRSALVRSCPRKEYAVGLGPHLETAWSCVPGHGMLTRWLADALLL